MKRDDGALRARVAKLGACSWVLWIAALSSAANPAEPASMTTDSDETTVAALDEGAVAVMQPLPAAQARVAQARVVPLEPLPLDPLPLETLPLERLPLPEVEPPEAEPTASDSRVSAVEARLRDWAAAWSRQRIGDYLSFYSSSFRPANGMTRQQWARARNQRLSAPSFIRVELDSLEVRVLDSDRAWVEFVQAYTSDSYHDVVTKMLELAREEDGWKIVAETVIPTATAPTNEATVASAASSL